MVHSSLYPHHALARWGFSVDFLRRQRGERHCQRESSYEKACHILDLLSFVQLAQRPLFRAAPGACLLLYSRSLKRPGFPRTNRRMVEERLLLGIGVELPDARWIAVHEHRKARTEGFFAGCQKFAPLLATAQNSGLAGANSGVLRQVRKNPRSEEHTSELQSHLNLVCRL